MLFTLAEKNLVEKIKELPKELYFLEWNGSVYQSCEEIGEGKLIQLHFRSCGGKGGL
jgi:hypothetical protein